MKSIYMIIVFVCLTCTVSSLEIYNTTPAHGATQLDMTARNNNKLVFYTINASEPTSLEFIKINGKPITPETASISWVDKLAREQRWEFSIGLFEINKTYIVTIEMQDVDSGEKVIKVIQFDTFSSMSLIIQAENYDYNGGEYSKNPQDYSEKKGVSGVDYYSKSSTNKNDYRKQDSIIIGEETNVKEEIYVNRQNGEWCNYTRIIPAGIYTMYARAKSQWNIGKLNVSVDALDYAGQHAILTSVTEIADEYSMVKIESSECSDIKIYKDVELIIKITVENLTELEGGVDIDYIVLVPVGGIEIPQLQVKEYIEQEHWKIKETGWEYNSAGEILLKQLQNDEEFFSVKIGESIKSIKACNYIFTEGYLKIVVD